MKHMPKECLHEEVADWVLDPGNTAGRAFAYDRMLMTYWVTMRMVGHSSVVREAKGDGDPEPIHFWK